MGCGGLGAVSADSREFGLSSAGKLLFARLLGRVRKLHGVKPIDVIHAHGALPCGHASALLSRHLGIPFVVTVHGLDVFNTCSHGGTPAKWRRQESVAVYQAARIVICISEKVQQILRDGMRVDVRSAVVYNGTDAELFSPGLVAVVPSGKEILIVGNLIASKGQELALSAISRMGTLFPHLRCQIIGEGPDLARLEVLASKTGTRRASSVSGASEPRRSGRCDASLFRICAPESQRRTWMCVPRGHGLRQTSNRLSRTRN